MFRKHQFHSILGMAEIGCCVCVLDVKRWKKYYEEVKKL